VLAGDILASLKQDKEAIEQFKKALEIDPSKEEIYLHLAVSQVRIFEYEEAVNTLKGLLKAIPDSPLAYYYLGKTYDQMKLSVKRVIIQESHRDKTRFEQAYIDLGVSLESREEYDNAIITYKQLLEVNPLNINVIQHLIQLYIHQQRFEEALSLLQSIAHSGAGGLEVHKKIGLLYLEMERYDDAVKEFNDILRQDPEAYQVRFILPPLSKKRKITTMP